MVGFDAMNRAAGPVRARRCGTPSPPPRDYPGVTGVITIDANHDAAEARGGARR